MVDVSSSQDSRKRQANSFLLTITAVIAVLAKRATRLAGKPRPPKPADRWKIDLRTPPPKSPLATPKRLFSHISSKALSPFGPHHGKKKGSAAEDDGWGDGGVWQKDILMGGKCEPLDFSGAIFYDSNGKQLSEVPFRSPRASPLPGYLTRSREQHAL